MNTLVKNWFRQVDIFPEIINQMGWDANNESWAKRCWKVAYRDARLRAKLFCYSLDELVSFRGFGVMKQIFAKSGNIIGRARINDLRDFDNNIIANSFNYQDYNPNKILLIN